MKKITIICTVIILIMLSACSSTTHISSWWLRLEDVDELMYYATHVVRVEVIGENVQRIDMRMSIHPDDAGPRYSIVTIYEVRITEIFQGEGNPGDIINVMQSGGRLGREEWICNDKISFAIGDDVILFLNDFRAYNNLHFALLTPWQSVFKITPSTALSPNATHMPSILTDGEIASLPGNHITLTPADLRAIAESNNIPAGMDIARTWDTH